MLVTFFYNGRQYENYDISKEEVRRQLVNEGIDIESIAKKKVKQELNDTTDLYFYSQAKRRGGYLNMGEIERDKKAGDPDALFLDALYDAIWEKEEELEGQVDSMSLEELLNLNIEAWVKPLYDQIVAELENTSKG